MDQSRINSIEINNNSAWKRRNGSQVSVSSASSFQSDSSEDHLSILERKASLQDIIERIEDTNLLSQFGKKCRSMSDGEAVKVPKETEDGAFEVLPSLPNSVLEKMGLSGIDAKDMRLNEDDIEQKFVNLALNLSIDGATIKNRCERQRRHRDQTETNLSTEIERLREKLSLLQPLCTDFEKAELLSTILTQIDSVMNATSLVSTAAERYGSVQQEEKLADSVSLMVQHVQMLKQQRDSARRQLVYTKRVLQNSQDTPELSPTIPQKLAIGSNPNRKVIGRRRASIATISQQNLDNKSTLDVKRMTRRTSELSLRAASSARATRPNRLELGGELLKISEGFVIDPPLADTEGNEEEEIESDPEEDTFDQISNSPSPEEIQKLINFDKLSLRERIRYKLNAIKQQVESKYNKWSDDGTIHEVTCFCAVLCFSMSLLTMVNILIEYEYAKRGWGSSHLTWSWWSFGGEN